MLDTLKTLYSIGRQNATDNGQRLICLLSGSIDNILKSKRAESLRIKLQGSEVDISTEFAYGEERVGVLPSGQRPLVGDRIRQKVYRLVRGTEKLEIKHGSPIWLAIYWPHVPTRYFTRNGLPCSIFDYNQLIQDLFTLVPKK